MRLTLLRAKEALARRSPAELLDYRINRICERYLTHGKFAGSLQRLAIAAPYGQLTLPRNYRTVEGIKNPSTCRNLQLGSQWFDFLPGRSAAGYSCNMARDLGDGHAIMYSPRTAADTDPLAPTSPPNAIPSGGTITVDYPGIEAQTVSIYGRDIEGMPIELHFTAEETKANVFARISRIHKETGGASVRVTYESDDAVQTVIAMMEPREEETYLRRYMVDALVGSEEGNVDALCKRRHIEFTSDQDILPFASISALEKGMDALQFEDENDETLADQLWNKGVGILNAELSDLNPNEVVPPFRVRWIGGTPNLTSRY